MSAPLQILRVLAAGGAWSPEDLVQATGLDRTSVDNAMRKLRSGHCLRSRPQTYEITSAGLADLDVREARALEATARPDVETMVSMAVRHQSDLQAAWSAERGAMTDDTGTTPRAPGAPDSAALHERVVGVCESPCGRDCTGAQRLCGAADATACGAGADQGRSLSPTAKRRIEREASRAAADCFTRNEACPYPFHINDPQERHWTACFVMKGGKL